MTNMLTIDVAHPPRRPGEVEEELLRALSQIRNSPTLRVLKIVHGYGSSGKGGTTKETVRNWVFRNKAKCRQTIDGENYGLYDAATQEMRKEVGAFADTDLDTSNSGITLLWVK
jgi:hypothetical protein